MAGRHRRAAAGGSGGRVALGFGRLPAFSRASLHQRDSAATQSAATEPQPQRYLTVKPSTQQHPTAPSRAQQHPAPAPTHLELGAGGHRVLGVARLGAVLVAAPLAGRLAGAHRHKLLGGAQALRLRLRARTECRGRVLRRRGMRPREAEGAGPPKRRPVPRARAAGITRGGRGGVAGRAGRAAAPQHRTFLRAASLSGFSRSAPACCSPSARTRSRAARRSARAGTWVRCG